MQRAYSRSVTSSRHAASVTGPRLTLRGDSLVSFAIYLVPLFSVGPRRGTAHTGGWKGWGVTGPAQAGIVNRPVLLAACLRYEEETADAEVERHPGNGTDEYQAHLAFDIESTLRLDVDWNVVGLPADS